MASEEAIAAREALIAALKGPLRVSGDAGSVEQHPLPDIMKAADYVSASDVGPRLGLRFTKLNPPGTAG